MHYDTKELEKKALSVIKKKKLIFINEVANYLPCSRATFYNQNLDKLDSIKDAIEKNKVDQKAGLRVKWYDSDNSSLQISLYKLISSDEERKRLSQQFHELSGNVSHDKILDTSKLKTETLEDLFENGLIPDSENPDNE